MRFWQIYGRDWMTLPLAYYQHSDGSGNFGDEISRYIVSQVSGQEVVLAQPDEPKLFAVGSLLHMKELSSSDHIWGTGMMAYVLRCSHLPHIHAVRGPLTRQFLMGCGQQVPEVYGDPALLLPRYYQPELIPELKNKIVVVPHWSQWGEMNHLAEELEIFYGAVVINPTDDWQTVVNQIASAKAVVSTSLHGLIIADAYDIPNIWLNSGDLVGHQSTLKFQDYLLSQNRAITSISSVEEIESADYYSEGNQIDLDLLVEAFPSDLSEYLIR